MKHTATGDDSYTLTYYKDDLSAVGTVYQPAADALVTVEAGETWRFSAWCRAGEQYSGPGIAAQIHMFGCDLHGRSFYLPGWLDAGRPPWHHPHSANDTWSNNGRCVAHRWRQIELTVTVPLSPSWQAPYAVQRPNISGLQLRLDNDGGDGDVIYWDGLEMRRPEYVKVTV